MILKLGKYHWGLKLFKVYINDDPGLTLTYFTARSNWVTCTFGWGKLLQSFNGGKLAAKYHIDLMILLMKKFDLRGLSAPAPGLYTCI